MDDESLLHAQEFLGNEEIQDASVAAEQLPLWRGMLTEEPDARERGGLEKMPLLSTWRCDAAEERGLSHEDCHKDEPGVSTGHVTTGGSFLLEHL